MNILITTSLTATSPSGVITYCNALTKDLASADVNVRVIELDHTPKFWKKVMAVPKRLIRPLGGFLHVLYDEFAFFTGIYWAARKLRNVKIDLIHAQDVRSGVAVYLALGRKLPIVLTCHFNDDPVTELTTQFSLSKWAQNRLSAWYQYLFSHVKNYVFVSNYAYKKSKHLLPDNINVRILHNTVNDELIAGKTKRKDSDRILISNVGYMDERKNQKLLIQIGHELRKRGISNFAIWLVGDGPKRSEYEQLVNELELTEQVKFYGRQPAPWRLVAETDLYIHTALNDNCPYSIIEAFAVKTPVLALPVGGVPELLPEGFGPLTGTDVKDLTNEVVTYFDPQNRTRLASEQSAFANVKFNHRAALNEPLSFYQESVSLS